jgi:hypothetical protein
MLPLRVAQAGKNRNTKDRDEAWAMRKPVDT